MSHFEFITVAVSIVLGLSIARLLTALPHAWEHNKRYWVHGVWCLVMLSPHFGFWWSIWIYRDVEPWSYQAFVVVLLTPALLYMTVTILCSDDPSSVSCWRRYFFERRRLIFSLGLAVFMSIPLRQLVVLGESALDFGSQLPMSRLPAAGSFLALMVCGVISSNERLHAALAVTAAVVVALDFASL